MIMDNGKIIFSQNCRGGLSLAKRRLDIFHNVRKKKYNIVCLQDVHINRNLEPFVKADFSSYTTNSRGCMILMNNNFEQKENRIKTDKHDYYIILDMTLQGKQITLVNLYGPNEDNVQFYEYLIIKIAEFENEHVIICGDWNFVLDFDKDTSNYLQMNSPRARQTVLNFIEKIIS